MDGLDGLDALDVVTGVVTAGSGAATARRFAVHRAHLPDPRRRRRLEEQARHVLCARTASGPWWSGGFCQATVRLSQRARQAQLVASVAKDQATSAMLCGGEGVSGAVVCLRASAAGMTRGLHIGEDRLLRS